MKTRLRVFIRTAFIYVYRQIEMLIGLGFIFCVTEIERFIHKVNDCICHKVFGAEPAGYGK